MTRIFSFFISASMALLILACATEPPGHSRLPETGIWQQQVACRLGLAKPGPKAKDVEFWRGNVSRALGILDPAGHGPDPGSAEWRQAVNYKLFGDRAGKGHGITFVSATGDRLYAVFPDVETAIATHGGKTVTLSLARSASGARYTTAGDRVLWNKGERITYWQGEEIVFEGVRETACTP